MEAQTVEPNFQRIVKDFQHFLNVREDNHKFIEHLFMERLKFEAEMIEKLEVEIDQLKSLTLRQCPNCGIRRPKRYHRSSQTPHYFYKRDLEIPQSRNVGTSTTTTPILIVSKNRKNHHHNNNNNNNSKNDDDHLDEETITTSMDLKLKRLNDKVDRVANKTNGMLRRSYELEFNSDQLRKQLDQMKLI